MRLLYLYVKFYDTQGNPRSYRNFPFWSINFSTDRRFRFIPETGELEEPRDGRFIPEVPQDFWGRRIYNATAFVSSNGGGKSTIMQYLILLLADLEQNLPNPRLLSEDWVIVFELDGDTVALQNKSILTKKPRRTIHAGGNVTCLCSRSQDSAELNRVRRQLLQTKLVYLSNVLTKADETFQAAWLTGGGERTKRFLFDASAYAFLRRAERDCRDKGGALPWFFTQEQKRMFQFLTSPEQRSLLAKLRRMNYPVPVPQQLTVRISEEHFPIAPILLPENPYQWSRWAFPRSWENVRAAWDDTPAQRVEEIIFSLCCGVAAGCLKRFEDAKIYVNWPLLLKKLRSVKLPGGYEGGVVLDEFLSFLDAACELFLKTPSSPEPEDGASQYEPETKVRHLIQRIELCRDYIQFLCSQQSRAMLAQYLPPADPADRSLTQLGEQIPLKFTVPLEAALREERDGEEPVWFIEFYRRYLSACGDMPYLSMDWGLSSGEENLLKMFTSLQEICLPAGERKRTICNESGRPEDGDSECATVWLFLDEADLTYHPEWQRQFMAVLTAFLQEAYPPELCREMQIFLSTHSPLMLGDFPGRCVVYLRSNEEDGTKYVDDSGRVDTFGENLFTLLHSSFYLQNGEIGELAKRKIQDVLDFLTEARNKLDAGKLEEPDRANAYERLRDYQDKIVPLLAEGPIKTKLWLELNQLEDRLISSAEREHLVRTLEAKLRYLKGEEEPM